MPEYEILDAGIVLSNCLDLPGQMVVRLIDIICRSRNDPGKQIEVKPAYGTFQRHQRPLKITKMQKLTYLSDKGNGPL